MVHVLVCVYRLYIQLMCTSSLFPPTAITPSTSMTAKHDFLHTILPQYNTSTTTPATHNDSATANNPVGYNNDDDNDGGGRGDGGGGDGGGSGTRRAGYGQAAAAAQGGLHLPRGDGAALHREWTAWKRSKEVCWVMIVQCGALTWCLRRVLQ